MTRIANIIPVGSETRKMNVTNPLGIAEADISLFGAIFAETREPLHFGPQMLKPNCVDSHSGLKKAGKGSL